jgi:hypothetical protein
MKQKFFSVMKGYSTALDTSVNYTSVVKSHMTRHDANVYYKELLLRASKKFGEAGGVIGAGEFFCMTPQPNGDGFRWLGFKIQEELSSAFVG